MERFGVLFVPFLLQTNSVYCPSRHYVGWLQPNLAGAPARRDKPANGGASRGASLAYHPRAKVDRESARTGRVSAAAMLMLRFGSVSIVRRFDNPKVR